MPPSAGPDPVAPSRRVVRLRPLVGRRLPRALQADRAWATARTLPDGVSGAAFTDLVHRIDGSPWHHLAGAHVFRDGADAIRAMLAHVAEARGEVLVETYILRDDAIGALLRDALAAAAGRGVRVALLADAVGSYATARAFWHGLERDGVTVRLFHPWWRAPWQTWRRDHRKLLVIDRRVAYSGGMNIGEEYGSSLRHRADVWRDTFVRTDGEVARELAAVFAEGWDLAGGPVLPGLEPVRWRTGRAAPADTAGVAVTPADGPRTLVLDARPGRGQPETVAVLATVVGAARERLWITNPYFAPPDGALTILADAAARGVDVRLLLPGRSDVPLLRHAAHGAYARLLAAGVRVYEYQRAILHAKTMVVDGALSLIGSANLDFRSLWYNAECTLLLHDATVAATLEAHFRTDLEASEEITASAWRRRTPWHRLGDTVARGLRVLL